MKILYVISDDFYFLSHRFSLAIAAKNQGYEVHVATNISDDSLEKKIQDEGFHCHNLQLRSSGIAIATDLRLLFKLWRLFLKIKPDIVHTVSIRMVLLNSIAFHLSPVKKLVAAITGLGHLATSSRLLIKILKWGVLKTLRLLFSSKSVELIVQNNDDYQLAKELLISPSRLHMIRGSGVDINAFPKSSLPSQPPIVVSVVSRMLKDKGIVEFIEAAKLIKQQGHDHITFQLIGDIHLENPLSLTRQDLQQWDSEEIINWLGPKNNIADVWRNSHIAVLPSYREGLPKSLLEAAACARPIITTDVPGCREVVEHGKNGLLVPVKSSKKLAEAILKIAEDTEMITKMGNYGREMVEQYFADTIVNKQTLALYGKPIVR